MSKGYLGNLLLGTMMMTGMFEDGLNLANKGEENKIDIEKEYELIKQKKSKLGARDRKIIIQKFDKLKESKGE